MIATLADTELSAAVDFRRKGSIAGLAGFAHSIKAWSSGISRLPPRASASTGAKFFGGLGLGYREIEAVRWDSDMGDIEIGGWPRSGNGRM